MVYNTKEDVIALLDPNHPYECYSKSTGKIVLKVGDTIWGQHENYGTLFLYGYLSERATNLKIQNALSKICCLYFKNNTTIDLSITELYYIQYKYEHRLPECLANISEVTTDDYQIDKIPLDIIKPSLILEQYKKLTILEKIVYRTMKVLYSIRRMCVDIIQNAKGTIDSVVGWFGRNMKYSDSNVIDIIDNETNKK